MTSNFTQHKEQHFIFSVLMITYVTNSWVIWQCFNKFLLHKRTVEKCISDISVEYTYFPNAFFVSSLFLMFIYCIYNDFTVSKQTHYICVKNYFSLYFMKYSHQKNISNTFPALNNVCILCHVPIFLCSTQFKKCDADWFEL